MTPYDTTDTPKRDFTVNKPSRDEAEKAVEVLLRWAGDNPQREGLLDTPARVARAYEEFFAGYTEDPEQMLERTSTTMQVGLAAYLVFVLCLLNTVKGESIDNALDLKPNETWAATSVSRSALRLTMPRDPCARCTTTATSSSPSVSFTSLGTTSSRAM